MFPNSPGIKESFSLTVGLQAIDIKIIIPYEGDRITVMTERSLNH